MPRKMSYFYGRIKMKYIYIYVSIFNDLQMNLKRRSNKELIIEFINY